MLAVFGMNNANEFEFTFKAESGFRYQVEVSNDLKNWSELRIIENATGMITVRDPAATAKATQSRFYRIR